MSIGDLIASASSSYLVEEIIGEGNYGQVARCVKTATNEKVAVKVMINDRFMIASAKQEVYKTREYRMLFSYCKDICLE